MSIEPQTESLSSDDVVEWVEEGPLAESLAAIHTNDITLPAMPPEPTIHSTDPKLLEELESSNEALKQKAWFEFNDRYKYYIYFVAVQYKADHALAQELVNEVLERVYKRIATYDRAKGRFRNWLWAVTRNATFDRLRKQMRRNETNLNTAAVHNLTDKAISEWWKDIEFEHLTNRALVRIERSYRGKPEKIDIFKAYVIGGESAREVAQKFEVTENVVRMTKNALMPKFKAELKLILSEESLI